MDDSVGNKLKRFFSVYKSASFKNKETIIRAEDNPSGVYYLYKGFVRMDTLFENGSEITFNIFKPGTFFPSFWAIGEVENSYNYTAMGRVEVLRCPKEVFLTFLKKHPDVYYDLTRRLIVGVEGLLGGIKVIIKEKAGKRVAWSILMLSRRFGKPISEDKIRIQIKLTHQDVARISNLTRESTSLEIEKLIKMGTISFNKGLITVNKIDKLQNILMS